MAGAVMSYWEERESYVKAELFEARRIGTPPLLVTTRKREFHDPSFNLHIHPNHFYSKLCLNSDVRAEKTSRKVGEF
jgi:hypothetical protein